MPNTSSAIRRVRRVVKQTAVNRLRKSKYKAAVKKMEDLIKSGIIDPTAVTVNVLENAVSVVSELITTDCVITNVRA